MKTRNILLIFLVFVLVYTGIVVGYAFYKKGVQPKKNDPRCEQKVVGEGLCYMLISSFEYDKKSNSCRIARVGGCDAKLPFKSEIDCKNICVFGWVPKTGYEKTIMYGLISHPELKGQVKIEDSGKVRFKSLIQSKGEVELYLRGAENLNENMVVAVFEKSNNIIQTKNESSAKTEGSFVTVLNRTDSGYFETNNYLILSQYRAQDIKLIKSGDILKVGYSQVPCGGNFPSCDSVIYKDFKLNGSTLVKI